MTLHLSEVEEYLLKNWDVYEDMGNIEEQIDDKLAAAASRIRDKLRDHPTFPSDWTVRVISKSIIEAAPKAWQQWEGKSKPLASVHFWSLNVRQLVSPDPDERAVFDFGTNFANAEDPRTKTAINRLTERVQDHHLYVEPMKDRHYKGQLLCRSIDRLPVEDGERLEGLIVDGLVKLIGEVIELIGEADDVSGTSKIVAAG